jgi:uncharacterized protein
MRVNLYDIFTQDEIVKTFSLDFDISNEIVRSGVSFEKPAHINRIFTKGISDIRLELNVAAPCSCICDRCLKSFKKDFKFKREFIITRDFLTDSDNEVFLDSSGFLDLKQLTIQEIIVEIPTVLLCSDDCQGLCPVCGNPKSEGCKCEVQQVKDDRMSVFDKLFYEND